MGQAFNPWYEVSLVLTWLGLVVAAEALTSASSPHVVTEWVYPLTQNHHQKTVKIYETIIFKSSECWKAENEGKVKGDQVDPTDHT